MASAVASRSAFAVVDVFRFVFVGVLDSADSISGRFALSTTA